MKNTALGKFIFIVGTALLLGGCSGMVMLPMPPTVHRSESLRRREAIASGTRIAATTPQETVTASHRETAPKVKIASSTKMVSHGHTKATVTPVVKPTAVAPAKPAPAASGFSVGGACWC